MNNGVNNRVMKVNNEHSRERSKENNMNSNSLRPVCGAPYSFYFDGPKVI